MLRSLRIPSLWCVLLHAVHVSQASREGSESKKKKFVSFSCLFKPQYCCHVTKCITCFKYGIGVRFKFCIEWTCHMVRYVAVAVLFKQLILWGCSSRDILLKIHCGTEQVDLVQKTKLKCQNKNLRPIRL